MSKFYIFDCWLIFPNEVLLKLPLNISVKDLSITYIIMNLFTQMLFFPYSIHFKLYPLITVNSFLSLYDICIIIMYYNIEIKKDKYEPLLPETINYDS